MDKQVTNGDRRDGFRQPRLRQTCRHIACNTLITSVMSGAILIGLPPGADRGWIRTMATGWGALCTFDRFASYGPTRLRRYLNERLARRG